MGERVNLRLSPSKNEIGFLCLNFESEYKFGSLKFPASFAHEYGCKLPGTVYLYLPCGSIWYGSYVKSTECIDGLENFMHVYDVKPYNVVAFEYRGGGDFGIKIFNSYALEIDYGKKKDQLEKGMNREHNVGSSEDAFGNFSEVGIDKLFTNFSYNGYSTWREECEFFISKYHLQCSPYTKVFSDEALTCLGLKPSMKWIELGFKKFRWTIKLKWCQSRLFFKKQWNTFAKEAGLHDGDLLVLLSTPHDQKFEVVVYEKKEIEKFNKLGCEHRNGNDVKWLQIMNEETVDCGDLELPLAIDKKMHEFLHDEIKLILADGYQYVVYLSNSSKLLYGLKKIFKKYRVLKDFVLCFEYVGRSSFFLSIYTDMGMDIFKDRSEKLFVNDVLQKFEDEVIILTDSSMDDVEDLNDVELESNATSVQGAVYEEVDYGNVEAVMLADEIENSFTAVLTKSNVNNTGHGVYFARHLLSLYRLWKNGTVTTLVFKGNSWEVALLRKKKICRFGLGWNQFTSENELSLGQKLRFHYSGEYTFEVSIVV